MEICLKIRSADEIKKPQRFVQLWNQENKQRFREKLTGCKAKSWTEIQKALWEATPKKIVRCKDAKTQVWWNESCYLARKEMTNLSYKIRNGSANMDQWRNAKRRYKDTISRAKEEEKARYRTELDGVRSINDAWSYIRKHSGTPSRNAPIPSEKDLANHFRGLLEGTPQPRPERVNDGTGSPLTNEEFYTALKAMKDNKAAGPDNVKAEALKWASRELQTEIQTHIQRALDKSDIPKEWCTASIWPIHKKGDSNLATNYRGIAVGNTIYKLMATIVNNRLKEYVEQQNILPDTQNGFRSGRSTIDNISILNHCIEKSLGSGKKLYAMFIDFKTAFDNV